MPEREGAEAPLSHVERETLAGELIGATVDLPVSPALRSRVRGAIVDESLSTFTVRLEGGDRRVMVPKRRLSGTVVLPSGELPLRGEVLRVRPEDRTKRLLAGGPRRYR
jgi:RNase P/RNase MRP subunit p29